MNLDHDFFSGKQIKSRSKKGLHQKWNTFFPRIQVETCAQMQTRVKLVGGGGDADVDHTQIIGGIYPPSPRVSAPLPLTQPRW